MVCVPMHALLVVLLLGVGGGGGGGGGGGECDICTANIIITSLAVSL